MATKMDPRLSDPLQGSGPGAYLRKAREDADISVRKVASALLLHTATVESLEADAYERLPAPTFVRGYLRGYARVLGLPSGPVLEMYDRQGFEPPPLSTDVTEREQAHTSDTAVKLVTYAVAVVLALLVGLWWHSQEDGGFGIAGDLFDRSPETDQDSSTPATGQAGATPDEGGAGGDSVAMVSGRVDVLPQDEGTPFPPPVEDAESGGLAAGTGTPHDDADPGATGAGTEGESGASPEGEDATAATPTEDATLRGGATADPQAVGAVTEDAAGAATAVQPVAPREDGATDSPIAGSGTEDVPGATAALAPGASDGDEDSTVTVPVTDATPGAIVEIAPEPAGSETVNESVAAQAPRPGTAPGDEGTREPEPAEEATSGSVAESTAAAGGAPVPETTADGEAPVSPDAQPGTVPGAESTVVTDPETAAAGTDAEGAAGTSRSTTLAAQTAPEDGAAADNGDPGTTAEQAGLVLEFVHESWVEVYDRERTRLFFGLVQPGRRLDFDGPKPFDILLGYGKDVRVTIDGQAFDYTPFLKHEVARFSIGEGPDDSGGVTEAAATPEADAGATPATEPGPEDRGE